MRMIPTKVHGVFDYLFGTFLIGSPWLTSFARNAAESWTMVVAGTAVIVYTLLTDFEFGVTRTLSMRQHLTLDFFTGLLLAASPWLLSFSGYVYLPHLLMGLTSMVVSRISIAHAGGKTFSSYGDNRHQHAH